MTSSPDTQAIDLRSVVFSPVSGAGLAIQTTRRLSDAIKTELLKAGDKFPPESVMCEWLHISPMTLRESLAILRNAGYIETRRGRGGGNFVTSTENRGAIETDHPFETNEEYRRDLQDIRRTCLSAAAEFAAERASNEEILSLHLLSLAMDTAQNAAEYVTAESRFHIELSGCSRSKRLWKLQTSIEMELSGIALSSVLFGKSPVHLTDHSNRHGLVEALKQRNPSDAWGFAAAHSDASCAAIFRSLPNFSTSSRSYT